MNDEAISVEQSNQKKTRFAGLLKVEAGIRIANVRGMGRFLFASGRLDHH
ncbi:MAG: hypothetical protein ACLQVY_15210 [Limisphaerales bacterium]